MNRVKKPALRGSWLGSALVFVNPIVRVLLATPLHWPWSHWFLLLTWTGKKSGQERSTPVSYVTDETGVFVTTGDRWPTYVVENPSLRVRTRGRWTPATAFVFTDPDDSLQRHQRIFAEHAWFRILAGIPSRDGKPDTEAIATAIASGRKLVRLDLESADEADPTR